MWGIGLWEILSQAFQQNRIEYTLLSFLPCHWHPQHRQTHSLIERRSSNRPVFQPLNALHLVPSHLPGFPRFSAHTDALIQISWHWHYILPRGAGHYMQPSSHTLNSFRMPQHAAQLLPACLLEAACLRLVFSLAEHFHVVAMKDSAISFSLLLFFFPFLDRIRVISLVISPPDSFLNRRLNSWLSLQIAIDSHWSYWPQSLAGYCSQLSCNSFHWAIELKANISHITRHWHIILRYHYSDIVTLAIDIVLTDISCI